MGVWPTIFVVSFCVVDLSQASIEQRVAFLSTVNASITTKQHELDDVVLLQWAVRIARYVSFASVLAITLSPRCVLRLPAGGAACNDSLFAERPVYYDATIRSTYDNS